MWGLAQIVDKTDANLLHVHIYPEFGKEHTFDASCWCLPERRPSGPPLGRRAMMYSHHQDN